MPRYPRKIGPKKKRTKRFKLPKMTKEDKQLLTRITKKGRVFVPVLRVGTRVSYAYMHRQGEFRARTGMVLGFVPAGVNIWLYMPGPKEDFPVERVHFRQDTTPDSRYLMVVKEADGAHYYSAPRYRVHPVKEEAQ